MLLKKRLPVRTYLFGELISKALPFAFIPYISNSLGSENYGTLAYYYAISAFLIIPISFIQESVILRSGMLKNKYSSEAIKKIGWIYSTVVTMFLSIAAVCLNEAVLVFAILMAYFQIIFRIQLCTYQYQDKPTEYVMLQVMQSSLSILLTLIFFSLLDWIDYKYRLAAVTGSFIISVFISLSYNKSHKVKITLERFKIFTKYVLSYCSPLVVVHLTIFLKGQYDRVYLSNYYEPNEVGVYALAFQLASVLLILLVAISRGVQSEVYSKIKARTLTVRKFVMYSYLVLLFSLFLPMLAFVVPESLYLYIFGMDFLGMKSIFLLFIIAFCFQLPFSLISILFGYFRKTRDTMWISIASVIVYIVLLVYLSSFGINVVPWATIVSNVFALVLITIYVYGGFLGERNN